MNHPGPTLFDTLPEHDAPGGAAGAAAGVLEAPEMPAEVLADLHQLRTEIREREVRLMARAVAWADMHPVDSIHHAATVPGTEGELAIAGEGAPLVAEFCIAEFAAAMGMSTDAGRHYLGCALETRHRLPRCQTRLESGQVDPWRIRRVAEHPMSLSQAGAAWVDTQVAPYLHKIGPAQLQRLIEDARRRFHPEPVIEMTEGERHGLHVQIKIPELIDGVTATAHLDGILDLADALDLDAALSNLAADLAAAGCPGPLSVRRALALGELARNDLTLHLAGPPVVEPGASVVEPGERQRAGVETTTTRPRRTVELIVHLQTDPTAAGGLAHFARLDNTRTTITTEQLREWLSVTGAKVIVRPVLDLEQHVEPPRDVRRLH